MGTPVVIRTATSTVTVDYPQLAGSEEKSTIAIDQHDSTKYRRDIWRRLANPNVIDVRATIMVWIKEVLPELEQTKARLERDLKSCIDAGFTRGRGIDSLKSYIAELSNLLNYYHTR